MGWIGCIHCDKFRHDFVARTFAIIAPFQLILHRVSYSNEMVPDAPKHYETQQKMSLGSNGGGLGAFIVKTSNATLWHELLHQFGPFCTEFCKATKPSQMQPNSTKCTKSSVYGPMGWIGCCFGSFRTIWVHSGPFGCFTKLGAIRAELVQKYVPRSRVGIFRNGHTRSSPLDPKMTFR